MGHLFTVKGVDLEESFSCVCLEMYDLQLLLKHSEEEECWSGCVKYVTVNGVNKHQKEKIDIKDHKNLRFYCSQRPLYLMPLTEVQP